MAAILFAVVWLALTLAYSPMADRIATFSSAGWSSGVVACSPPVDDHDRFVADHPGVVALGKGGDIAGVGVELGAVGHLDVQCAGYVVLKVRRLAPVGAGDRLDVLGPLPAGLQGEPADVAVADP